MGRLGAFVRIMRIVRIGGFSRRGHPEGFAPVHRQALVISGLIRTMGDTGRPMRIGQRNGDAAQHRWRRTRLRQRSLAEAMIEHVKKTGDCLTRTGPRVSSDLPGRQPRVVSSVQFVENEIFRTTKKGKMRLETNVHLPGGVASDCLRLLDIIARDERKTYETWP